MTLAIVIGAALLLLLQQCVCRWILWRYGTGRMYTMPAEETAERHLAQLRQA
jgi:hypothetical protein